MTEMKVEKKRIWEESQAGRSADPGVFTAEEVWMAKECLDHPASIKAQEWAIRMKIIRMKKTRWMKVEVSNQVMDSSRRKSVSSVMKILTQTWNSTDFTVRVLIKSERVNMSREREREWADGGTWVMHVLIEGVKELRGTEYDVATQRGIKQANGHERQAYDPTGQSSYREACKMLNVIPVSYFLRNMNQSELNMMHYGLGSQGTKALAISLVTNTSILKLNLRDNWMEGIGGAAIADMLKENCYITEIDLSENRMGEYGARALSSMLLENSTLFSLNLSGNHLDERAARHLSPALIGNQKLQHLDLSHNRFGDIAGEILGAAIAENAGIKSLNLAWNCIRGKGAIAFAKGLEGNIFLRTLDLSYNGLGKEGAVALEEALKHNNTLEDLNIGNNRIPLEGAIHFALGLKVNTTLRILKMSRNPMQSAGCFAILKSVQANPETAVEFLDFSDICVDQEFEDLFESTKETLPNLQVKHGGKINAVLKKS
ncbi:hypothetical protein QQF64_026587 [Cirrhinus molitorella]|uniref:Uncharacterized protein n=1 Tax=Cirrhinus molitorella TaxID=172907 RepID=A0ABR3NAI8_9TELE